jgi:predicted amidohydrolase YtcJ
VLARRGGHVAAANTAALRAAPIEQSTPDPPGGRIDRHPDGSPTGLLDGSAVYQGAAFAPPLTRNQLVDGIGVASAACAALGVGTIREALIDVENLLAYQDAAAASLLSVRVRPLIRVGHELSADDAIALIRGLGARSVLVDAAPGILADGPHEAVGYR